MSEPRYARDMDPIERAYTEALHDIGCGDGSIGVAESWSTGAAVTGPHPLEDHEPFDVDEGSIPWAEMLAAFRKRGLLLVSIAQPWPLDRAVERLATFADHLLRDHDCDQHGYEEVMQARDAARTWLATLQDSPFERDGLTMDMTTVSAVTWDRLRAAAFPDAATTPVAQGPVIVMHTESAPGSGLTACTGQPFSPWHITDPGEAILSCTGCLLVGVEDSPLERDISAQVGERTVSIGEAAQRFLDADGDQR